jgi:hypothetical protein
MPYILAQGYLPLIKCAEHFNYSHNETSAINFRSVIERTRANFSSSDMR